MASQGYSSKETALLEGVLTLFAEGTPFHAMKVADIAEEAGIGKGTVYEYFKSKEELIACAVVYQITQEFVEIVKLIRSATSFRQCTLEILWRMSRCYETQSSSFFLIRPDILSMEEVASVFTEMKKIYEEKEKDLIAAYLAIGVKEKLFPPIVDEAYSRQVIVAAMSGFHVSLHTKKEIPPEVIMNYTYHLMVKSLQ